MTWTLHEGDCLGVASAGGMGMLEDRSVDVTCCDPPYSVHTHAKQRRGATGYGEHKGPGAQIARSRDLGFDALTDEDMCRAAREFARVTKRWVLIFCDAFQIGPWTTALSAAGLEVVRVGAWVKPGSTPQFTGDRPAQGWEPIIIGHPHGRKRWNGGGKAGVWECPIVLDRSHRQARLHTTQKPLPLMEALILDFTERGETVLDSFAGSSTTGVAALRHGRRFIGWELQPKYAEVSRRRLAEVREQASLPLPAAPRHRQLAMEVVNAE